MSVWLTAVAALWEASTCLQHKTGKLLLAWDASALLYIWEVVLPGCCQPPYMCFGCNSVPHSPGWLSGQSSRTKQAQNLFLMESCHTMLSWCVLVFVWFFDCFVFQWVVLHCRNISKKSREKNQKSGNQIKYQPQWQIGLENSLPSLPVLNQCWLAVALFSGAICRRTRLSLLDCMRERGSGKQTSIRVEDLRAVASSTSAFSHHEKWSV